MKRTLLVSALLLAWQAHALTLGRLNVLSSLGEPLRAEVELQDFSPTDATALRLLAVPATAYSTLGQQNNALASSFDITLISGPGAPRLLLSSRQAMDVPFVDFVIEVSWPAGRSVREYTALFNEKPNPTVPAVLTPEPLVPATVASILPANSATTPTPSASSSSTDRSRSHTVQAGETAGSIAQAHLSKQVSLEQMLLALLRDNPQAFVGENVNRLRAGSVLNIPSATEAQSMTPSAARAQIQLQHHDFEALRQRIAQAAPSREVPTANREISGSITTPVQTAPAAATDKLTLSKSAAGKDPDVHSKTSEAATDKVAQDLQTREVQSGNQEIASKLEALNKLSQEVEATAQAGSTSGKQANEEAVASASDAPSGTKPEPDSSSGLEAPGTQGGPAQAQAEPAAEPGLLTTLIASPWMPALAAGLLAAMGGLAALRIRQRRKPHERLEAQVEPEGIPQAEAALAATPWQAPVQDDDPSTAPSAALPEGLPSLDLDLDVPAPDHAAMSHLPDLEVPKPGDDAWGMRQSPNPATTQTMDDLMDDEPDTSPQKAPSALPLNLEGLSLDLDVPVNLDVPDLSAPSTQDDPMATKLALAQEFLAMGDKEGARALVDEVLAKGGSELRARAESLLFELA